MSHPVFRTAQVMPLSTQAQASTAKPLPSPFVKPMLPVPKFGPLLPPIRGKVGRRGGVTVRCSSASAYEPAVDGSCGGESRALLEQCFQAPSSSGSDDFGPVMKGQYGAFGAVTLEKGKLDMTQKQSTSSPELATGGGGGDIGKRISHGGGDGGDDDGDDDDYFDDFDDGDEGDEGGLFRRRMFLEELFDRKFVNAVLNEWQKTMMDLPAGFRQACELGLVSSAQMVKFLAINARPTTARFISRSLPEAMSRAFIGRSSNLVASGGGYLYNSEANFSKLREYQMLVDVLFPNLTVRCDRKLLKPRMIADPAFLYKLLLEQAATIGFAVSWELKNRKERIKQEWDLALVNILTASLCNAAVVWSLAPCRSYGDTFRFDLQNTLQKLPNNIFEKSYPMREFDLQKRFHSFCFRAAELCMLGLTAGSVQGSLSNFLASKKKERLSVTIPTVSSNALGYGAFLGIYANLSYQLLCGSDRLLTNHFDVIGVALFFGTALRIMNDNVGQTLRHAWLGMEPDPLAHSDSLLKAYNRSEEVAPKSSPKWFISKNAIVSGLGLFGSKEGNADNVDGEAPPPKARRKRIVRKKVTAS